MYCYMLSDFLKKQYGEKIYKLSLDGGMTCPNRDGTCGTGGCLFCSSGGSGEFAEDRNLSIDLQIESAKSKLSDKTKSDRYIAYFQPYSNTYQSIDYLRKLYTAVVNRDDIAILSIATRPDCVTDETIDLLIELNEIKPVWVELGLQTIHEDTAKFIRRGYPLSVYTEAVTKLKKAGVPVITHLILGLPSENKNDMLESARYAGELSDGIKFHMLYVAKDTDLAKLYVKGEIELLSKEEYIDILCDCIRVIPENVVIHRLTGDGDKESLIAPIWTAEKIKLLRDIKYAFYDRNVTQGEYLNI